MVSLYDYWRISDIPTTQRIIAEIKDKVVFDACLGPGSIEYRFVE